MSFIVKFCVRRHQFHVFLAFLHRLLRPKRVRRLGFSFSPGTSNYLIVFINFYFIYSAWFNVSFSSSENDTHAIMNDIVYIDHIWKLQTSRCRHLRYANEQSTHHFWLWCHRILSAAVMLGLFHLPENYVWLVHWYQTFKIKPT
jgi:hypothetical protein